MGEVGKVDLGENQLQVGIELISRGNGLFNFEGFVLGDSEIKIHAPVPRFTSDKALKVGYKEKRQLNHAKEMAFNASIELCRVSFEYKMTLRQVQLGRLLRKEVDMTLRGKGGHRSFGFGPCCPETDFVIFGLNSFGKKEFSYRVGNLGDLDCLLGDRWDVNKLENRVYFVTSVVVRINEHWIISGRIAPSVSWKLDLSKNYRTELC